MHLLVVATTQDVSVSLKQSRWHLQYHVLTGQKSSSGYSIRTPPSKFCGKCSHVIGPFIPEDAGAVLGCDSELPGRIPVLPPASETHKQKC